MAEKGQKVPQTDLLNWDATLKDLNIAPPKDHPEFSNKSLRDVFNIKLEEEVTKKFGVSVDQATKLAKDDPNHRPLLLQCNEYASSRHSMWRSQVDIYRKPEQHSVIFMLTIW